MKENVLRWTSLLARRLRRGVNTLAVLVTIFAQGWSAAGQSTTALSPATALYARVVRLAHSSNPSKNGSIVASVTAFPGGAQQEDIYASVTGSSFGKISSIRDPDFASGLCCGTLFELPKAVGALRAGTLLWAGSVGQGSTTRPMKIKVYKSADQGATWVYLSNVGTAASPDKVGGGLWEPDFEIANDGGLVCFYSDETVAGHSQLIRQVRSYDGVHWQDSSYTVASEQASARPGMPEAIRLPSGSYFMTYEVCGPAACTAYSRTSADGWHWGNPTDIGTKIVTTHGQWLEHAPTNAWAPTAASPNGTILVVAQMMLDKSGAVSGANGVTILTNHSADGSGEWSTMPAPIRVPNAHDNYCPNYSSPLLPSVDGQSVLELASDNVGSSCTMFFGAGPILAGEIKPSIHVTPTATTITTLPFETTVTVDRSGSLPVPTGTVTLHAGSITMTQALASGSASFSIAGPLPGGNTTLTATYSGDSNYAEGTAAVVVRGTS